MSTRYPWAGFGPILAKRPRRPFTRRVDGVLIAYCWGCVAHVQESLGSRLSARYEETIICHACGRDNSVRPPLAWRWSYGVRNAKKRRRVLGWFWWTRYAPWKCWMMPYEMGSQ